jgi:hypothetical protein
MTRQHASAALNAVQKPAAGVVSAAKLVQRLRAPTRPTFESASRSVLRVVGGGGGQPLDDHVRAVMEPALGFDLSTVRVHTDREAAASADAIGAKAYTIGEDVVFGAGWYQPAYSDGQRLLAHELTHVVQQRIGPVVGTSIGNGLSVSDPCDLSERAAEVNADRIMSNTAPARLRRESSAAASRSHVRGASNGLIQRIPLPDMTFDVRGVPTGASFEAWGVTFYEWNFLVSVKWPGSTYPQLWMYTLWVSTNDPAEAQDLEETVIEDYINQFGQEPSEGAKDKAWGLGGII